MVDKAPKTPREKDVENAGRAIAKGLGSVSMLPFQDGDDVLVSLEVKFQPQIFDREWSNYKLYFGFTKAFLEFESSGYDFHDSYEAHLDKATWQNSVTNSNNSTTSLGFGGSIKIKLLGLFSGSAQAEKNTANANAQNEKLNATYPIISSAPTGWTIGSYGGDPRNISDGMEGMLSGSYFNGHNAEVGQGLKSTKKKHVAAKLVANRKSNTHEVRVTLFGAHDALVINAIRKSDNKKVGTQENDPNVDNLKAAVLRACLKRSKDHAVESGKTQNRLNADYFLHGCEKVVPAGSRKK